MDKKQGAKTHPVKTMETRERSLKSSKTRIPTDQLVGLGPAVRTLRLRKEMTRKTLCKRSGLSMAFLYRLEKGKRQPSQESIEKIARSLKISVKELENLANDRFFSTRAEIFDLVSKIEDKSNEPKFERAVKAALALKAEIEKLST